MICKLKLERKKSGRLTIAVDWGGMLEAGSQMDNSFMTDDSDLSWHIDALRKHKCKKPQPHGLACGAVCRVSFLFRPENKYQDVFETVLECMAFLYEAFLEGAKLEECQIEFEVEPR